jgi:acyl-CoA synthetase (AMP-forming)/AMP-acid ligase II
MILFDAFLHRTKPIYFWHSRDLIETWSADDLKIKVACIAETIKQHDVKKGDIVVLMLSTSIELVASFLAVWSCRATVCIVPHLKSSGQFYEEKMNHIFGLLQPKLLIHNQNENLSYKILNNIKQLHVNEFSNQKSELVFSDPPNLDDIAIIQLTSGSTAFPKGVVLSHANISANISAIDKRVRFNDKDHNLSWLPLYHDMGLSGLLISLYGDFSLTLIPTECFIRNPTIWMEAITQQKATLSEAPVFAFNLVLKQLKRLQKQEIYLSTWRYAWIGAEPVYEKHLKEFQNIMAQFGLRENVLQPAYGLAEAVVCVSSNPPFSPITFLSIDADILHQQGRIKVASSEKSNAITFVSNGVPVESVKVCVKRENGEIADIDEQGVIWIAGDSITKNYLNNEDSEKFENNWFNTGDLGFIYNGEIYISGRLKDLIIRGGVNISPAYIEMIIENYLDLRSGKVVAFSYQNSAYSREESAVVIGLDLSKKQHYELQKNIATIVLNETGLPLDYIQFIQPKKIPKTTSGKVQRSIVKKLFLENYFSEG